MSDYYGANDEKLGEWVPCTIAEYDEAILRLGFDSTVFAARTEVGQSLAESGLGAPYRWRHIHTEWGRRDAVTPTARCTDVWDYRGERTHDHALFVLVAVPAAGDGS